MQELARRKCRPWDGGMPAYDEAQARGMLKHLDGWALEDGRLVKRFPFADYHHTMAFVNALAWVSHREDHHPDLEVGYKQCVVRYWTHAAGGLTENDFICAAKCEALFGL